MTMKGNRRAVGCHMDEVARMGRNRHHEVSRGEGRTGNPSALYGLFR